MPDPTLSIILENIREVLTDEVFLISGFRYEFRRMADELEFWIHFLRDLESGKGTTELFAVMEKQIREVFYDTEDTMNYFLALGASARPTNVFRRRLHRLRRLTMAGELISLTRDRLRQMMRVVREMSDGTRIGEPEQQTRQKVAPSIRLENVVGFEDEAETLINYLMEETEELDVVSITGMPGIGKTTLAWKIYQNEKILFEFPTRIWVHASQEFDRKDLYVNILKKFTEQDLPYLSDIDELELRVLKFLENEKFLLVMDDVWTIEPLENILRVLRNKTKGGKILLTSRDNIVCRRANVARKPHMLRFLNEKESWELLQLAVFGKIGECPQRMELVGECVAKKCCGLPLAIVAIANSLVAPSATITTTYLAREWWKRVSENVTTYITNYGNHLVSNTLAVSYGNLPDRCRHCFLYLGVFPEDYEIPSRTLTRLWIAEGFVRSDRERSLEGAAEDILDRLINNNSVMVDKRYPNGKAKTCRVHKVIRGFCKSEAAEQNLFQEMKLHEEGVFDPPIFHTPNYRRLCVHSHLLEFLSREPNGRRLRSFLCFHEEPIVLDPKDISPIIKSSNLLRVFESISIKFTCFPDMLTKLIHLGYISLSCDNLSVLPETFSQLWNLQTLLVHTQSPSLEIKANIWRMFRLRHLITKAAITLAIEGKGNAGGNLQTLSRLSPKYCKDVFKRAQNLKSLGIRGQLATLLDVDSLRALYGLEKLKLVNESLNDNELNYRLFHPNFFPSRLKSLTLSATRWDLRFACEILGKIDTLEILKLKDNAFTGESWNTDPGCFPCLEFLFIGRTNLVSWEVSAGCFPRLKYLVLKNCGELKKIPLRLAESLETLDLENVSRSVVESAREIEEQKARMQGQQKGRSREFKLSIDLGRE